MESGEGRSKKGEMTARFHGDGIRAAERRKSMMETVGSCRRDGPGKKGEWGQMHKEGRASEGGREPLGEAGRKEGQARPEANPSIQVQKRICALMSPVTYQNNSKNQVHCLLFLWAPPFPVHVPCLVIHEDASCLSSAAWRRAGRPSEERGHPGHRGLSSGLCGGIATMEPFCKSRCCMESLSFRLK